MRKDVMKPNAKRINNQSFTSILKVMAKITKTGNIKVANNQYHINLNGASANDINYTNNTLGA